MGRGGYGSDDSDFSGSESDYDDFKDRHRCTDVPCCIIFTAAVAAFGWLFVFAAQNGDVRKLSHGINQDGLICGVSPGVEDSPYLYFCPMEVVGLGDVHVDPTKPVCLSECPTASVDNFTSQSIPGAPVPECGMAAAYSTTPWHKRFCMPDEVFSGSAHAEAVGELQDFWEEIADDGLGTGKTWPLMLLVVVVATILGYAYLFLLRAVARVLIWVCAIASLVACLFFGYKLWTSEPEDLHQSIQDVGQEHATTVTKVFAVLLWILGGLIICFVCCCAKAVALSTACVQTATLVMWKMPTMLLAPFIKAFSKVVLALVLLAGWIHVLALGEVHGHGMHRTLAFTGQEWGFILFYILLAYWILEFVSALYQFCIAYAVARYYHTPEDPDGYRRVGCCGVQEGLRIGLFCHAGSLAFGSFIIAVLKLCQRIVEYMEAKNKSGANNACVSCILRTVLCVCKCVEGILKFINKNVYIDIAITSNNFCSAIRNVMHIILDHGAAMAILNAATWVFQIVGLLAITAISGAMTWAILQSPHYSDPMSTGYIANPEISTGIACVIAFIIAWAFMAIFDITTDTLLYCFADDKKRNRGCPLHAPSDFVSLYDEAESALAKQQG